MQTAMKVGGGILLAAFLPLWWYLATPTMAFGFYGLPFMIILAGVIALLINYIFGGITIAAGMIGFIVLPIFTSWPAFHSGEYHSMLGEVEESVFSQDLAPVDVSQMRIVDQSTAGRLGEKRLGEDPALGSRAQLSDFRIQEVNGELYWVAPVVHSGFFKWWKFDDTPGYVMVSATNDRDVKYVTEVNGEAISLRYQPEAYFGENLRRHLYMNGYASAGLTDYTFEIDNEGNPFWVVTIFEKEVGYSGADATGVIVVDPATGEFDEYSIADAPAWIDRIQPENIVTTQINNWGAYGDGWWNSFLAREGVLKTTPGMSLVYGEDGNSYWYTGISSAGRDGATVGFMLVNTRSKEVSWYRQAGATETQAQESAQGQVQEKRYTASFPVLYNVAGIPTYVMALKDDAGLIKAIAMVSVEDYGIVGVGDSSRSALRAYRSQLANKGNAIAPDGSVESFTISGEVARFATDVTGGQTYYYIYLTSVEDKMFIASSGISQEVPITQVGDTITVTFLDGGSGVIDLSAFDNEEIRLAVSEDQAAVEARFDRVEAEDEVRRDATSAEQRFDELSPEDQARLLELLEEQGNE